MNEIYKRNVDLVYRISYMLLRNRADAEDAVQSIFLKLFKSDQTFTDYEHEKAWIIVATKNHCKDSLKSWWRTRQVDIETLPDGNVQDRDDDDSNGHVLEELLKLPEKYKIVLYLYYFEGYSVREISVILARKDSTIQTQLAKGRHLMKISLGGYYEKQSY